jgi:hypothetical protein
MFFRFRFHGAIFLDVSRAHLRVGVKAFFLKSGELNRAGGVDSLANHRGRLARVAAGKLLVAQRGNFDLFHLR